MLVLFADLSSITNLIFVIKGTMNFILTSQMRQNDIINSFSALAFPLHRVNLEHIKTHGAQKQQCSVNCV